MSEKLVYSMNELCEVLSMSRNGIYSLIEKGLLKRLPGTRKVLFSRKHVEAFLNSVE